jgi:hypothetical protein
LGSQLVLKHSLLQKGYKITNKVEPMILCSSFAPDLDRLPDGHHKGEGVVDCPAVFRPALDSLVEKGPSIPVCKAH